MFTEIEAERHVTWQPSLLGMADAPDFDPSLDGARRRFLGRGAWVDVVPGWVTGADVLFDELLDTAPWKAFERPMYDRVVDVPRLETRVWFDRPKLLDRMARCLGKRYGVRLPSIAANLYRDGNDSVAWHGDRIGDHRADAVVAILSLGATRTLLLRPDGGGPSMGFPLHSGDLLVQGGTCQRTFEHCVPKRALAGPRISVMFRQRGGN
ncbi:MAG: alpha-ketoglutarate-dependent dioxygenase AlkB [Acidimicrobiales bacterium]